MTEASCGVNLRYILFVVAYDGSEFSGSQLQKNALSVQGELERAAEVVLGHPARVVLAGRTDAGVHATGQVGRFTTSNSIPAERVSLALNRVLNKSVRVQSAREVGERFHPRFSAKSRTYRYWIENSAIANPLTRRIAGRVRDELNLEAMKTAAPAFLGAQDFAAWQSAGSPMGGTVRDVKKLAVRRRNNAFGSSLIEVEIEANAFLYQMVRNIVGALIKVGQGELSRADIERLTQGRDRTKCPPPAPPQGLCLTKVRF